MPIENRNLEVGTRLVANYKKQAYVCTVEEEDGKPVFVLEDGKRYKSPSSAASAVIGGAANGWRFWSVEGETKPAPAAKPATAPKATRSRTKADSAATKTKAERKPRARKAEDTSLIRLAPRQDDLGEGEARWWCNACMASFVAFGGETPAQCPNGHRSDDPELTAPATIPAEAAVE